MRRVLSTLTFALAVSVAGGVISAIPMTPSVAYQSITLEIPSQLPQATQGKAFSYSFSNQVRGGTGPPYIWNVIGKLPLGIHLNSSTGQLSGVISKSAKISSYLLKVCATGAKRPVTGTAPGNTACTSTRITVAKATATAKLTPGSTTALITMIPTVCVALTPCDVLVATATGGTPPYQFVSNQFAGGTPPMGMSVDINGRLAGTAQQQGVFTFGVCVIDSVARQSCRTTTVTVTAPSTFRITINKNGDGQGTVSADSGMINCGATCQGDYVVETRVTLTAIPAVGSVFSNWSGACTGVGACTFTLNADSVVTATFTASATGTYSGNVNFPDVSVPGISGNCGAQVMFRSITLQESAGGKIAGKTDSGSIISGARIGSAITVTLQTTHWGLRGPYVWQWNGTTLAGTLPAVCYDTATYAILKESSYPFTLQKG